MYIKIDGKQIVPDIEMAHPQGYIHCTDVEFNEYLCGKKIIKNDKLVDNPDYKEIVIEDSEVIVNG